MLSKREFVLGLAAAPVLGLAASAARSAPAPNLKSLTSGARAISADERRARIAKASLARRHPMPGESSSVPLTEIIISFYQKDVKRIRYNFRGS